MNETILTYVLLAAVFFLLIFTIVNCLSSIYDYRRAIKRIKNLEEQFDLIEMQNSTRLNILEEQCFNNESEADNE